MFKKIEPPSEQWKYIHRGSYFWRFFLFCLFCVVITELNNVIGVGWFNDRVYAYGYFLLHFSYITALTCCVLIYLFQRDFFVEMDRTWKHFHTLGPIYADFGLATRLNYKTFKACLFIAVGTGTVMLGLSGISVSEKIPVISGVIFGILSVLCLMFLAICVFVWIETARAEPIDKYSPYCEMMELKEKKEIVFILSIILLFFMLFFGCFALWLLKV